MGANPWMKFYPADWRSDPQLRMCSLAARGLWMEMICLMHDADPYGHLVINRKPLSDTQIGALTGADPSTVRTLLSELEAFGVFSRNRMGVIYSRRMVVDAKRAAIARANGAKGGDIDLNALANGEARQVKRFNRKNNPTKVQAVWEACGGRCAVCGQKMDFDHRNAPNSFEVDHIIPLTQGGTNDLENLRGCCKACNLAEAKRLGKSRREQSEGHPSPNPAANGATNPQKLDARNKNVETQESDTPANHSTIPPNTGPEGPGKAVAFMGKSFSLNQRDFDDYRRRYYAVPDFLAALQTYDAELADRPKAKVFAALQAKLLNSHQYWLNRKADKQPAQKSNRGRVAL